MRHNLLKTAAVALAALAAAGGLAPAARAEPKPVNPDWPPIPMEEELFGDDRDLVARTSDFVQSFYECLSSCAVDEQLGFLKFPAKIVLPTATIRTPAQYRAEAEREQRDVAEADYFVNTFKATGDADEPVVHVTVLRSGVRRTTGEPFRFLTDEQLRLVWDDESGSYAITQLQINTMAPA
ncbi:hypothetical protein Srot_1365 [Segniliparus rotundus DSM 44985]|uniref:SnoaL-like domain-containing protein n=1 Tax=Segniliparus rotundus (strain ATCC BAA-972 / CDC 1076 / CIP 108378 / DSM 44985 / JCM 13578) TaxID=640132 RepID=D6Z799_SEGRD|nr:hypothetical protein [Segniliparus rotundus]ADG97829.1 hypothetical protein Srot_1365 [Segniliparus rotundus DSM 44985]